MYLVTCHHWVWVYTFIITWTSVNYTYHSSTFIISIINYISISSGATTIIPTAFEGNIRLQRQETRPCLLKRGDPFAGLITSAIGQFSRRSSSNGVWLAASRLSAKKHLLLALCQLSSSTRQALGKAESLLRRGNWEPGKKRVSSQKKYKKMNMSAFIV